MAQKQIVVVVALPFNEKGELLISRRNDPELKDAHGKWQFVGGRLEHDETPEQAVVREVKEESGLDVTVKRMLPKAFINYWKKAGDDWQTVLLSYECEVVGGQLHTSNFDEKISELKFIKPSDIGSYDTLPKTKEIIDLLKF